MKDASGEKQSPTSIPPDRYDLRILTAMRQILRGVSLHSRKLIKDHKITSPQLVCLLNIVEAGELTVASIAKKVFLSASTVVGILDRLEEKGLIQRERSKKDRRVVLVRATEEGLQFAKSAPSPLQDTLEQALQDLNDLEQATICLALERVAHLMGVDDIDASPILAEGQILEKNS